LRVGVGGGGITWQDRVGGVLGPIGIKPVGRFWIWWVRGGWRTITVSGEAYGVLARRRLPGESFTEEMMRLLGPPGRGSPRPRFGGWDMPDEEFDRVYRAVLGHP